MPSNSIRISPHETALQGELNLMRIEVTFVIMHIKCEMVIAPQKSFDAH